MTKQLKAIEERLEQWNKTAVKTYAQAVKEVDGVNHLYDLSEACEYIEQLLSYVKQLKGALEDFVNNEPGPGETPGFTISAYKAQFRAMLQQEEEK